MPKIRKAGCLDKIRLKKMISFLSSDIISHYTKVLTSCPWNFLHDLLPLSLKKLPETYVIEENKSLIGMVTLTPTPGNPYKLTINRLFLEQDYFSAGKQLIDFVVARYGAKGASTLIATVDELHSELLSLFSKECGFRHCSSEQLWKIENVRFAKTENTFFRPFKNSDAESVANLFNENVITHFKHSLSRTKKEYIDPFMKKFKQGTKQKFIIDDINKKEIKGYFSIMTEDNLNFILDITSSGWYECCYEDILNFAINQLNKHNKKFNLFVKVKKYSTKSNTLEEYLKSINSSCVQTQIILVKDFYKLIKEQQPSDKILLFNGINETPVFKVQN